MAESTEKNRDISSWCGAAPGRMPGFVQPWLLLLLAEAPAHGYQLLERLHQHPDTQGVDAGFLYRTLRQFELEGYVRSTWNVETPGPARRVYEITPVGIEYLHVWAEHVRGARARLGRLLQAYESYCDRGAEPMGGETRE
jgi:PadR family transcriptional regulator, regulatory protein PadR